MKSREACEDRECDVERSLPFLGPIIALVAMLVIGAGTAATMMM